MVIVIVSREREKKYFLDIDVIETWNGNEGSMGSSYASIMMMM